MASAILTALACIIGLVGINATFFLVAVIIAYWPERVGHEKEAKRRRSTNEIDLMFALLKLRVVEIPRQGGGV